MIFSQMKKRQRNSKIFSNFTYLNSVELINFKKFKDTAQAVESLTDLNDGKLPSDLKKFLKKNIISSELNDTLICKNINN